MAPLPLATTLAPARSTADWLLGGCGISAAAVSAGFAVYMVAVGPAPRGVPPGGGDFKVFVAFDRRPHAAPPPDAVMMPSAPELPSPPLQSAGPSPAEIDFTPTGSIGLSPRRDSAPALAGGAKPTAEPQHRLAGFAVRDVFDGKAVVEVRNRLTIVEAGSVIDGAGVVIAIRRAGAGWVVETTGGVIGR